MQLPGDHADRQATVPRSNMSARANPITRDKLSMSRSSRKHFDSGSFLFGRHGGEDHSYDWAMSKRHTRTLCQRDEIMYGDVGTFAV